MRLTVRVEGMAPIPVPVEEGVDPAVRASAVANEGVTIRDFPDPGLVTFIPARQIKSVEYPAK